MLFGILNNLNFSRPLVNNQRLADYVSPILNVQVEQKQCQHGDDEFCDSVPSISRFINLYIMFLFHQILSHQNHH